MFRSSGPLQYIKIAAAEYFDEYASRVYDDDNNEHDINDYDGDDKFYGNDGD